MARILLTWELGGGLGHLMNLRPLALELAARGHRVFVAARDLSLGPWVFGDLPIILLPAPWKSRPTEQVNPVITYADLLLNIGFGDADCLTAHLQAWRNLFGLVQPDLLICDHSPTALLAARTLAPDRSTLTPALSQRERERERTKRFPVATVGTGFFTPIDEAPLRLLRKVRPEELPAVRAREERLVGIINRQLASIPLTPDPSPARGEGRGSIERVSQLYHDGRTKHFLLTFPELDHFGEREGGDYRGALPYGLSGQAFVRPAASAPCVFAYLKPIAALDEVLQRLAASPYCGMIHLDGVPEEKFRKYQTDRWRLTNRPIDIREAAAGCDVAISNANPGTCTAMLLAGKPLVCVPAYLEQWLFAAAVERLGAGITVNANDAPGILEATHRVLGDSRFASAAADFAARHQQHRPAEVATQIVDDLETMLVNCSPSQNPSAGRSAGGLQHGL